MNTYLAVITLFAPVFVLALTGTAPNYAMMTCEQLQQYPEQYKIWCGGTPDDVYDSLEDDDIYNSISN